MRFVIIVFLLVLQTQAMAQLRYPIVGKYKGKSAQGMAIWNDEAFLFNDGGHCRVLDLKSGKILREFNLKSSGNNMHVATACFRTNGVENGSFPLLYVAEFTGKSRCFIEDVISDSSKIIQVIEAKEKGENYRIQCWLVDDKDCFLYSVSGSQKADSSGKWPVVIRKYRLPIISEGKELLLTELDKYGEFFLDFPNCLQGGTIRDGRMFLVTGFQQSRHSSPRGKRALKIIDLKNGSIVNDVDLTGVTTNEPEGLDFYGDRLLMYCGQEGGIYELEWK